MALHGRQKKFDKNGDGKLSVQEWNKWRIATYGPNSEMSRCRKQAQTTVEITFKISYHIDLTESWKDLKSALATLVPGNHAVWQPLLSKTLLHEISVGIRQGNMPPATQKMQELEAFLHNTPDLGLDDSASTILKNIETGILYTQEAALSTQSCGSFWVEVLSALRSEQYYGREPDGLSDLLFALSCTCAYFGGRDGEELNVSQKRRNALRDAFYLHWQTKVLLHPDVARAKQLLSCGELSTDEDICRNILVMEYPEEVASYALEELEGTRWHDLLDDVFARDAAKAVQMWRTLLDIAAPCLQSNAEAAKELLHDWYALDSLTPDTAEVFFSALTEDTFAKQIFQSASVWNLQRNLLSACHEFGRMELGQYCLNLVMTNRYLTESWERRLKSALYPTQTRAWEKQRNDPTDTLPDDGTIFRYCTVRFPGIYRPYNYLTGDLPLKVGDWVEVPFGKDGISRRGQIGSVTDCTRLAAPWPPEQTKTVLRMVAAPSIPEV